MEIFQEIMDKLVEEMDDMTFSEVMCEARERLGIIKYRVCELLLITRLRLRHLEQGKFIVMPAKAEIRDICELYDLPVEFMIQKARQQLKVNRSKLLKRKIYGKHTV